MGKPETTEWRPIVTELDGIESLSIDVVSGPANGSLVLLAAESGTIESRRPQPPFFLLEFSGAEHLLVQSDSLFSILGPDIGSRDARISESENSVLIEGIKRFSREPRHFVISGAWNHYEVVARNFSVRRCESEAAARYSAAEAAML